MKRYIEVSVSTHEAPPEVASALASICPDGMAGTVHFTHRFIDTDDRLNQVLDCLAGHGFVERDGWTDDALGTYRLHLSYAYDESELASADYLWPTPKSYVRGLDRDEEDGALLLEAEELDAKVHFAATGAGESRVVSSRFRESLEAAGLIGLVLRPVRLIDDDEEPVSWDAVPNCPPMWELTADRELPPLSDDVRTVLARDGSPAERGDNTHGLIILEDTFPSVELHYGRSDVQPIQPFDLALTREPFGLRSDLENRGLIVSQAFRQICHSFSIEADWAPVYLD